MSGEQGFPPDSKRASLSKRNRKNEGTLNQIKGKKGKKGRNSFSANSSSLVFFFFFSDRLRATQITDLLLRSHGLPRRSCLLFHGTRLALSSAASIAMFTGQVVCSLEACMGSRL